jgi:hypothetical protein
MGRGLSKLQRWILSEAGKAKRLYYSEILVGFFGWKAEYPMPRFGTTFTELVSTRELKRSLESLGVFGTMPPFEEKEVPVKEEAVGSLIYPYMHTFSKQKIGAQVYNRTMAALSRACRRLQKRGLVNRLVSAHSHFSCVEITEKGREFLSVNSIADHTEN